MATITLIRSTLLLDTTTSEADTTANNLTRQHSLVMSGFPTVRGVPARQALGVLYHIRPTLPQQVALLVQSSEEPDWSRLPSFVTKTQVEHLEQTINTGQVWEFACDANPSFRPSGRERQFLQSPSDQQSWWERRGHLHGFRTDSLIIQGLGTRRGDQGVAFSVVRFSGRLVVEDATRATDSFRHGVGPGKAFGCGLLRLAAYGDETAYTLSAITCRERPWRAARWPLPDGAPGSAAIPLDSMAEYYGGLVAPE